MIQSRARIWGCDSCETHLISPEVLAANCSVNEPGMKQWDLQLRQGHGVLRLLFHGAEYAKELTVFKLRPLTAGNLLQWLAFSKSPNYSIE